MAAKGASVSYTGELTPEELEQAPITGRVPPEFHPHLAQVLDEAPLQLVTKVVAEVDARQQRKPSEIWKNLRGLAQALMATRGGCGPEVWESLPSRGMPCMKNRIDSDGRVRPKADDFLSWGSRYRRKLEKAYRFVVKRYEVADVDRKFLHTQDCVRDLGGAR